MKGYGRSIAFWGFFMEKFFVLVLGTVLVMVVVMGLINEDYSLIDMIPTYLPMMGGIVIIVYAFNGPTNFIPQAVSFGGTRKETFFGMEVMFHVLTLQFLVLIAIGVKWIPGVADTDSLPYLYNIDTGLAIACYAVLLLLCCGAGNLICACGLKFGFKGQMVVYLVTVLLVVGAIIGMTFSGNLTEGINMEELLRKFIIYGFLGAMILDVVMMVLCYFGIKKFAVKA